MTFQTNLNLVLIEILVKRNQKCAKERNYKKFTLQAYHVYRIQDHPTAWLSNTTSRSFEKTPEKWDTGASHCVIIQHYIKNF